MTQHHSNSHHSSVHASTEKSPYGGSSHSLTISHSTSSSTHQSVKHKISTQNLVRNTSPHAALPPTSQNSHHLSHLGHHPERLSPATSNSSNNSSSLSSSSNLRHGVGKPQPIGATQIVQPQPQMPSVSQSGPQAHHLMIQPPSMGHPGSFGPPMGGSSLEALKAHAQAAASMQGGPNPMQPPTSSPMQLPPSHPPRGPPPEEIKLESDTIETIPDDDSESSPTIVPPRGPSPEPRIEDTECHRSQSAIFLRHWNRGDYNSCTRTDLTFKPVPDSKLARKREERLRKQAEKEREERERQQQQQAQAVSLFRFEIIVVLAVPQLEWCERTLVVLNKLDYGK